MSKRDIAGKVLGSSMLRSIGRLVGGRGIRILAYHRILDDDLASFEFDSGVVSATSEAFYEQMRFVRENFDVISFRDLWQCEKDGRSWPARGLIITFDDGYRDNYTNAFPILRDLKLPAAIFLTTGHIGEEKLFWWDKAALCFKRSANQSILIPELSGEPINLTDKEARNIAIGRVLDWIKRVPDETKESFLAGLPERLGVVLESDIAFAMHLSWDEVRTMSEAGIEFGSHTITHPVLSNVGPERLKDELVLSKSAIERETGAPVLVFAYPVGRRGNFNDASIAAVKEAGYSFAVSYDEGLAYQQSAIDDRQPAISREQTNRFTLPRIHVEADHSASLFRANLTFSSLLVGA